MQKRILRELSKTIPDNIDKHDLDYCVAVNSDETTTSSNIGNINSLSISSDKYNCRVILNLKPDYPFKPPTIINYSGNGQSYSYWCSRILNKKDNYSGQHIPVVAVFLSPTMKY